MTFNFFSSLKKQAHNGLACVGAIACTLHIMRSFGFDNPTVYDNYPGALIGAITSLIIVDYYQSKYN